MIPQEIAQMKQESPVLKDVLQPALWRFLRQHVTLLPMFKGTCVCGKQTRLFMSPYQPPDQVWCLECILYAFFTNAPFYEPPEPPYLGCDVYCSPPWELPDWPENYDGPPIVWA